MVRREFENVFGRQQEDDGLNLNRMTHKGGANGFLDHPNQNCGLGVGSKGTRFLA